MEMIAEFVGTVCGLVMRAFDWITGKRKTWSEGRKQ